MKTIFLIASILVFNTSGYTQTKPALHFSSINQLGIVRGSSDQGYQVQTTNGVKYKSWFAGLGVGIDDYYFKTIPVFVDVRKNLLDKKQTPFVYVNIGTNMPWQKEEKETWQRSEYSKGLFYEAGIGYSIPVKDKLFFNLSAGYSQKRLHESTLFTGGMFMDVLPYETEPRKEYYDYTFKRLSIKVALQF